MRSGRRGKVLLADDEDAIALGLARVLYQDNDRYDVLLARNGDIARQIMRELEIDVLATDIRMPGLSGLDLLSWASTESPATRVIVMTAYDVTASQEHAYRLGCISFVPKPFDLHQMREMILHMFSQSDAGLAGSLAQLSPADVIQMLCLGRKTTALRVADGRDSGAVYLKEGEILHALWNELSGEPAFYRILCATAGMFTTLPYPERVPQTIQAGWQQLLLEGMRLQDEQKLSFKEDSETIPSRTYPGLSMSTAQQGSGREGPRSGEVRDTRNRQSSLRDVAQLIDEGFNAMRDGDLIAARHKWEEVLGLDPDNRMVQLNLRRLDKLESRVVGGYPLE